MDQRALGRLAERAAAISERGDLSIGGRAAELSALVHQAAKEHRLAPWTVTRLIAGEWDRLGIRRVAAEVGPIG